MGLTITPDTSLVVAITWIVWDKREDGTSDNGTDCELAWTNLGGAARRSTSLAGQCRANAKSSPCAPLKAWALSELSLSRAEKRKAKAWRYRIDPIHGRLPDARPAMARGYKIIACEVAREYCDAAINAARFAWYGYSCFRCYSRHSVRWFGTI